jgi:hypothetical protein
MLTWSLEADTTYHYVPSETVCLIMIALFALTTGSSTFFNTSARGLTTSNAAAHVTQAIHMRTHWLFPTAVLAGMIELIGWFGRLWSTQDVCENGFLIQSVPVLGSWRAADGPVGRRIVTLIIAPTPLLAANFMILSRIISALGPAYSRLSPQLCTSRPSPARVPSSPPTRRRQDLPVMREQALRRGLRLR